MEKSDKYHQEVNSKTVIERLERKKNILQMLYDDILNCDIIYNSAEPHYVFLLKYFAIGYNPEFFPNDHSWIANIRKNIATENTEIDARIGADFYPYIFEKYYHNPRTGQNTCISVWKDQVDINKDYYWMAYHQFAYTFSEIYEKYKQGFSLYGDVPLPEYQDYGGLDTLNLEKKDIYQEYLEAYGTFNTVQGHYMAWAPFEMSIHCPTYYAVDIDATERLFKNAEWSRYKYVVIYKKTRGMIDPIIDKLTFGLSDFAEIRWLWPLKAYIAYGNNEHPNIGEPAMNFRSTNTYTISGGVTHIMYKKTLRAIYGKSWEYVYKDYLQHNPYFMDWYNQLW